MSRLLLVLLLIAPVLARADYVLSHGGLILDAADAPVTNPAQALTFRIVDQATPTVGEQVAWEATCPVAVKSGYYAVTLGAGCGAALTAATVPANEARFLEVTVGSVVLLPRLRLSVVPVAALASRALDADTLAGRAPGSFADALHEHAGEEITSGQIANARLHTGSGNGLDADLVDGLHASAFALASHAHTTSEITDFGTAVASAIAAGGAPVRQPQNLADLPDKAAARTNLGLGSAATLAASTDTALAANSDTQLPTQRAVKAYVDAVASAGTTQRLDLAQTDVGQLFLAVTRLSPATGPEQGGQQVADEFDDASGLASLGGASILVGSLTNSLGHQEVAGNVGTIIVQSGSYYGSPAGAFDGNASQTRPGSFGIVSSASLWIGKDWGSGNSKVITKASAFSTSDNGWSGGVTPGSTVTLVLEGSNTGAWGGEQTQLALATSIEVEAVQQVDLVSTTNTAFRYHRVRLIAPAGDVGMCEVRFHTSALPNEPVVPQGTGTVIAQGGSYYGAPANAFDGNNAQTRPAGWGIQSSATLWIGKDWGSGNSKVISKASVFSTTDNGWSGGVTPGGIVTLFLEASNTGAWSGEQVQLATTNSTEIDNVQQVDLNAASTTAYRYHRIRLAAPTGDVGLSEVRFTQLIAAAELTTVSNAYPSLVAPATVALVANYQDVTGTAVLNTDVVFEVSRDGGTSWTAVTMRDGGPAPVSGARVLDGATPVTGQPSGTSLKWRVRMGNQKEVRVHGLWMQWR